MSDALRRLGENPDFAIPLRDGTSLKATFE